MRQKGRAAVNEFTEFRDGFDEMALHELQVQSAHRLVKVEQAAYICHPLRWLLPELRL